LGVAAGLVGVVAAVAAVAALVCRAPSPRTVVPIAMDDAEAAAFFAGKWYVQWQTETRYLKPDYNARVVAEYAPQPPSWLGYTVAVRNEARTAAGAVRSSDASWLGAQRHPESGGLAKFVVAPQFVPRWLAGDYWIIAHGVCGETEFAVVCGGQPTIPDGDPRAGSAPAYTYDTDATNNSGLWVFTRSRDPPNVGAVYARACAAIRANGISLRGLRRVDQSLGPENLSGPIAASGHAGPEVAQRSTVPTTPMQVGLVTEKMPSGVVVAGAHRSPRKPR
jgi:hypothetical protein